LKVDGCTKYTVDVEENVREEVEDGESRYRDDDADAAVKTDSRGEETGYSGDTANGVAGEQRCGGHLEDARTSYIHHNHEADGPRIRNSSDEEDSCD